MGKIREIHEAVPFLQKTKDRSFRAFSMAMLETTLFAETLAKRFAARKFTGTVYRPKSGALLNAIFSGFQTDKKRGIVSGVVGVRSHKGRKGTRPYGRIHEYGGVIKPVKARFLWIPIRSKETKEYENMSPRDFVEESKRNKSPFFIDRSERGNFLAVVDQSKKFNERRRTSDLITLFVLRDKVRIPDRPYVTPAVKAATKTFHRRFIMRLKELRE